MADKWMDERDRRWRERGGGQGMGGDPRRFDGGEDRSFGSVEDYESSFGARRSGQDRDRVFGERETGMGYGGEGGRAGGLGPRMRGGGNWQDRDYQGVSPAMQQDEYDLERRAERYQQSHPSPRGGRTGAPAGGRYYGDGGGERIYRQEYGQGGVEYGAVPRGYDAGRGGYDRDARTVSGGTGGYDYERGYGDAGRRGYEDRDRGERWEQRGREAGRDTGDFFRRAGEKVASWFGGGDGERDYDRERRDRDFRGLGPKGYKRADERISDEAHERLTDDPWVDATNISISVSGGEITLSGTVENRESKHRAERCVEDISGVNHVQNNLRIDRGSMLTSPGRGYGDSVLEHQMRGETGSGDSIEGHPLGGTGSTSNTASKSGGTNGSTSTDTGKSR